AKEFKSIKLIAPPQWFPADATVQEETSVRGPSAQDYTDLLDRIEKAQQSLDKAKAGTLQEIEGCKKALLQGLLDFLNSLLHREACPPGEAIEQTSLLSKELMDKHQGWWPTQQVRDPKRPEPLQQLRLGWSILDELIRKLVEEPQKSDVDEE